MNAAEAEIPQGGAEGMLVTQGGRFGAWPHLHSTARAASAGAASACSKSMARSSPARRWTAFPLVLQWDEDVGTDTSFPVDDKN